jgi:hypothetical protein
MMGSAMVEKHESADRNGVDDDQHDGKPLGAAVQFEGGGQSVIHDISDEENECNGKRG